MAATQRLASRTGEGRDDVATGRAAVPLQPQQKPYQHSVKFQYRGIAQLVEQRSPKPRAQGSSPCAPAKTKDTTKVVSFVLL